MGGSCSKTTKQKTDIKNRPDTTKAGTTRADITEDRPNTPVTTRTINVQAASSNWDEEIDSHAQDAEDTYLKEQCERDISDTGLSRSQHNQRQKAAEASVLQEQYSTEKLFSLPGNSMTNTWRENSVRPTANGNRVTQIFHADSLTQTVPDKTNTGPQKSISHQSIYSATRAKAEHIQDDHQLANITREIHELREERNIMASVNKDLQNKLVQKDTELDELRTRLSRIASERLTDNNPNIADLSDPNRPLKIAEMYKELYNNEWSEAFDDLAATGRNDKDIIQILLEFIKDIYSLCFDVSQQQFNDLNTQIVIFTGTLITPNISSAMKAFKDERKKQYRTFLPQLTMETNKMRDIRLVLKKERTVNLQKYLEKSTELCWLMCIQDPPIHLHTDCKKGTDFDESRFTAFTVRGITVDYLVWPAILLHKNGPVLQKGTAQARESKKQKLKETKTNSNSKFSETSNGNDYSQRNLQHGRGQHGIPDVDTVDKTIGFEKIMSKH